MIFYIPTPRPRSAKGVKSPTYLPIILHEMLSGLWVSSLCRETSLLILNKQQGVRVSRAASSGFLVRLPNAAAANYELVCSSLRASWHVVVGSVPYLYRAAYLHLRPTYIPRATRAPYHPLPTYLPNRVPQFISYRMTY